MLDVDLVDVGGLVLDRGSVTLPHPRAADRAFVLVPWLDVDPEAVLSGRPVREHLQRVGRAGVTRRDDLVLTVPSAAEQ